MKNLAGRRWLHLVVLTTALLVGCSVSEANARSALAVAQAVTPSSSPGVQQSARSQTPADSLDRSPNPLFNPHGMALGLEKVADGIEMPTLITHAGDGSNRLFAVEKHGVIRLLPEGDVFLDISNRVNDNQWEQGLLGLAFHPRVRENGYFYVSYTNHADAAVLARFQQAPDGRSADLDSEYVLLRQEKPTALHNAGMLAFGPDGYLYVALGDGANPDDPAMSGYRRNSQELDTLLGKILRLDVDGGEPYGIPPDNPFVDDPAARPEIWAYGLRNPWRFSFDRATGDLYIGDVGQREYEAIYIQPADSRGGENYGWPIKEGAHCYESDDCDTTGFVMPVAEYDHNLGCAVVGGYAYRGERYPMLHGAYLYADYCSGIVWTLAQNTHGRWTSTEMAIAPHRCLSELVPCISTFGEDEAGELYVAYMGSDQVFRLTAQQRMIDLKYEAPVLVSPKIMAMIDALESP